MAEKGEIKIFKSISQINPLCHQQLPQLTKLKDVKGKLSRLKSSGLVDKLEENQWVILDAGREHLEQLLKQPPPLQPPEQPTGEETSETTPRSPTLSGSHR